MTRSYYRGAAGALLVFDITNRESFNSLNQWLQDARTLASPNIVILLVGNKKDLEADREITFLQASQFAQENGESDKQLLVIELKKSRSFSLSRHGLTSTLSASDPTYIPLICGCTSLDIVCSWVRERKHIIAWEKLMFLGYLQNL